MRFSIFVAATAFLFLINNLSTFGQIHDETHLKLDTIPETIIFEYDTVYLAPDTLKQVDTIVHYQQLKQNNTLQKKNFKFLENFNILKGFNEHWSLGVGFNTYLDGLLDKSLLLDSVSVRKLINYSFEVHLNYKVNQFIYSIGLGYSPVHEQFQAQSINGQNSSIAGNGSYDSLQIKSNCLTTNYYHYLNVFLNVGKKWGHGNVFFVLNSNLTCDILINSSALLPFNPPLKVNSSSIQKIGLKIGINPYIGFKFLKNSEFSLGPFCNYSVLHSQKYPVVNQFIFGIGLKIQ